jgi:replicative DNA helicase
LAERLESLPIFIDDTPAVSPSQLSAIARRMDRKHKLAMVVVDYIQIMGGDDPKDGEYDRVGKAATALKNLSKQVRAPSWPCRSSRGSARIGPTSGRCCPISELRDKSSKMPTRC